MSDPMGRSGDFKLLGKEGEGSRPTLGLTCPNCSVTLDLRLDWSGPSLNFYSCGKCEKTWAVHRGRLNEGRDVKPPGAKSERPGPTARRTPSQAVPAGATRRPAAEVVAERIALARDLRRVREVTEAAVCSCGGLAGLHYESAHL